MNHLLKLTLFFCATLLVGSCNKDDNDEPSVQINGTYTGLFELGAGGGFINFEDTQATVTGSGDEIKVSINYFPGQATFNFNATREDNTTYTATPFTLDGTNFEGTVKIENENTLVVRLKDPNDASSYAEYDGVRE